MKKTIFAIAILSTSWAWAQDTLLEEFELNGAGDTSSFTAGDFRGAAPVLNNLTLFPDRTLFDELVPPGNQSCEDFEEGVIPGTDPFGFPAPLDENTDNAVFAPGDIVAGLSISDDPINDSDGMGGSPSGLVIVPTAFGNATQVVVSNTFADSTNLNFATPQSFVAMDVVTFTDETVVEITFFDESDNIIDSLSGPVNPAGAFLGVQSDIPISRINIFSTGDGAEGADDICFATRGLGGQAVPTLSAWSIIALAFSVLLVAFFGLRRRVNA